MKVTPSQLKRPLSPMTDVVREALERRGLVEAYNGRPPYQRNDYGGWIDLAKRDMTRRRSAWSGCSTSRLPATAP